VGVKDLPVCFQNSEPEGRRFPCRFCGRLIIANDATLTVHHEAPICAPFETEAARLGGAATLTVIAR
jgi:hypothetical protein